MDSAHAAAAAGQLAKLESSLGAGRASQGGGAAARLPLALCKDRAGNSLLHKAVFRGQRPVVDWLLDNHPAIVHLKDRVSRGRVASSWPADFRLHGHPGFESKVRYCQSSPAPAGTAYSAPGRLTVTGRAVLLKV